MENDKYLRIALEPDCMAEALEDYFKKIEVISPHRKIESFTMPVQLDEEDMICITAKLSVNNEGMN